MRSLVSNSVYAKKDRNGPPSANQVASKDEPRRGHAVCTLQVHPPTSPCPTLSPFPSSASLQSVSTWCYCTANPLMIHGSRCYVVHSAVQCLHVCCFYKLVLPSKLVSMVDSKYNMGVALGVAWSVEKRLDITIFLDIIWKTFQKSTYVHMS